ncbi:MAG: hypothetical protein J6C09_00470 [Clostridia bacterium]|nr:hypothetical protein [Clostridia bacterium]
MNTLIILENGENYELNKEKNLFRTEKILKQSEYKQVFVVSLFEKDSIHTNGFIIKKFVVRTVASNLPKEFYYNDKFVYLKNAHNEDSIIQNKPLDFIFMEELSSSNCSEIHLISMAINGNDFDFRNCLSVAKIKYVENNNIKQKWLNL